MRESLGDVDAASVVGGELDRDVLQVGRRFRPKVDDDVEDGPRVQRTYFVSADGGNWKCIPRSVPRRRLKATLAWAITGFRPCSRELVLTEHPREESSVVLAPLEIDDVRPAQRRLGELHRAPSAAAPTASTVSAPGACQRSRSSSWPVVRRWLSWSSRVKPRLVNSCSSRPIRPKTAASSAAPASASQAHVNAGSTSPILSKRTR